jgi:CRP-like cAMP-binding protein
MSIEDDIALLAGVPTLRLLGDVGLRVLAIGGETRDYVRGAVMFSAGEPADGGFVVRKGSFRITTIGSSRQEVLALPGALVGELALVMPMPRPSTAIANEPSSAIRISRSLFQRVLDSDPEAAKRLREAFAKRTLELTGDLGIVGNRLSQIP